MALAVIIGITSLNSELLSQNKAFAFNEKSIDEIKKQCGLDELNQDADISNILESCIGDNPTQIPISKPIALLFINAAFILYHLRNNLSLYFKSSFYYS